ncbi:MAG TPA: energy transducer TonB [Chthoniobacterales bacterium]|jgi:TonB family protein|nr:energy transducer TonB [Chthoniobacterales bacterium]
MSKRSFLSLRRLSTSIALTISLFSFEKAFSAASDWRNQPKPAFPTGALEKDVEGAVRLRVVVDKDGNVTQSVVTKSSGNQQLDEAAKRGVLSWKMKRGAIKPADLREGRKVMIDFREEAAIAAMYPSGVTANFAHSYGADMWRSAPFPNYPVEARARHEHGSVLLKVKIGMLGNVTQVNLVQSSGHKVLDDAAILAVRHWKAKPRYAGQTSIFPVIFEMGYR